MAPLNLSDGSPRSEALPRAAIIRRRGVFELTRNKARRFHNRWMTLSYLALEAGQTEEATVAFLTPKRLGSAPVRNRLRRRMREIYRRHLATPVKDGYQIWIARPPAVELPFEELKKCMEALTARRR
jgi:ribonuclease P protein component